MNYVIVVNVTNISHDDIQFCAIADALILAQEILCRYIKELLDMKIIGYSRNSDLDEFNESFNDGDWAYCINSIYTFHSLDFKIYKAIAHTQTDMPVIKRLENPLV